MTIDELVDAAKQEAVNLKNSGESPTLYHIYYVPGRSDLSLYVAPALTYGSLLIEFEVNKDRVSRKEFQQALGQ